MPRITASTVVKLLLASLAVGLILAWLHVSPQELVSGLFGEARQMLDNAVGLFGWAFSYILLGAVIVVPIWLIAYLLKAAQNKKK